MTDIYTVPFTYLVGWSAHGIFYYGVRFAQGCAPADLWTSYFTSSKHVKQARLDFGEPDIVQVRRTFESIAEAREWEHRVLRRMKVKWRADFLNRTDNKCWPDNRGVRRTEEFKRRLSEIHRGKVLSAEHKAKIAAAVSGPRPAEFGATVSRAMTGRKLTAEHSANISRSLTGRKMPAEFCEKTRLRLQIRVRGPDGTEYPSIKHAAEATGRCVKRLSLRPGSGWVRLPTSATES